MWSRILPWLPGPVMIHAAVVVVILAAVSALKGPADPDYYWHLTAGGLIAASGVPSTDPFSFTWAGQPWTPHEWLSELLLYASVSSVGTTATLALFGALGGLAIGVVEVALTRRGFRTAAIVLPATLAAVVFMPYVTARPQAISWLLLAIELVILLNLRSDRPRRALWLVPLLLVWANLHGLYVIGLGVGAVYLLFTMIGRTAMADARGWILVAGTGALLASAVTPAGPIGLLYPLRYVDGSDWGLANIQEWQSPDFHNPAHIALLVLIVAIGLAGTATAGWLRVLSYAGVVMALLALRNAPLAAILALPALSGALERVLPDRHRVRPAPVMLGRRVLELAMGATIAIAGWLILVPADPATAGADEVREAFPVEAVARLRDLDPDARVVAEYGWAGYVIHELYPTGGRVFVDGRNDMYPESILEDYSTVRAADDGWQQILNEHDAGWLLFPPEAAIARGPATDAGWCEAYRDDAQVLLRRCS